MDTQVSVVQEMEEAYLSDQQLQQLLKAAEHRLRTSSQPNTALLKLAEPLSKVHTSLSTGADSALTSYIKTTSHGAEVDRTLLVSQRERKLASEGRQVDDPVTVRALASKEKKATAGADWYNLPRTVLTPELKRDLQLLRMRSTLDPKRFYKKENAKKNQVPEYSQVGTVIEGPTEFFSARLSNKERKRTLVEEVLAGEKTTQRFKSKYRDIQRAKTSGRKDYYKAVKAQRKGSNANG